MNLPRNFRIWRERPGVVSPGHAWCCAYDGVPGYLHINETLAGLLRDVFTNFRGEENLVGY